MLAIRGDRVRLSSGVLAFEIHQLERVGLKQWSHHDLDLQLKRELHRDSCAPSCASCTRGWTASSLPSSRTSAYSSPVRHMASSTIKISSLATWASRYIPSCSLLANSDGRRRELLPCRLISSPARLRFMQKRRPSRKFKPPSERRRVPGSGIITCIITYLVGCFEAISWECLVNRV